MICCILVLLVAGPLGVALVPIRETRRNVSQSHAACCPPRSGLRHGAAILLAFLLLGTSFATALHFLDPPSFRRLCTLSAFR
jgi:hypothetical protein